MTIAEVSKTFGLTADTLRYYERIGLIPPVKRSSSGIRDYDEKDCNWVEFIKCMRGVGIPVEMLNMWRCSAWARRRLLPVKLFW